MTEFDYDIAIVGGGLAGLTAAIQFRMRGYSVIVFEKKSYPFHRVCGEYISMESWHFLIDCGLDLPSMQLPAIKKLQVSAPNGNLFTADLDLGGFGMSRFKLDHLLYLRAKALGVEMREGQQVDHFFYEDGMYRISMGQDSFKVRLALGCFGKRSNIDLHWKRDFTLDKKNALNNFVGVKYHIQTDFPDDTIALHNFANGYCGLSKIEDDKYCLCYLTTAGNLQNNGGIKEMERAVLFRNKHLRRTFESSTFLMNQPVSIAQISFDSKDVVFKKVPLAGDACGMITPLCGNGMSMAMHGGKIFVHLADQYLQNQISLIEMLHRYEREWNRHFSRRLRIGRMVQSHFGKAWQTNWFISIMKTLPALSKKIIRSTHGTPF